MISGVEKSPAERSPWRFDRPTSLLNFIVILFRVDFVLPTESSILGPFLKIWE